MGAEIIVPLRREVVSLDALDGAGQVTFHAVDGSGRDGLDDGEAGHVAQEHVAGLTLLTKQVRHQFLIGAVGGDEDVVRQFIFLEATGLDEQSLALFLPSLDHSFTPVGYAKPHRAPSPPRKVA